MRHAGSNSKRPEVPSRAVGNHGSGGSASTVQRGPPTEMFVYKNKIPIHNK